MILGFNVGRSGILSLRERIALYKNLGCKAIEISLIDADDKERWAGVGELTPDDFESFEHLSLHAPALNFFYADNDATRRVLAEIQKLYEKLNFKHAIIHPERVARWEVFKIIPSRLRLKIWTTERKWAKPWKA